MTEVERLLRECGAFISSSHIVYKSGRHGSGYIDLDHLYEEKHREMFGRIIELMAQYLKVWHVDIDAVDVVMGPAEGGNILALALTPVLRERTGHDIWTVFTDKTPDGKEFVLRDTRDADVVCGANVLVVEDVLTTGGSVANVVRLIETLHCNRIVGVVAICNRGGVRLENVGRRVEHLSTLLQYDLHYDFLSWAEEDCPFCTLRIPINTSVGHGKEFVLKKERET